MRGAIPPFPIRLHGEVLTLKKQYTLKIVFQYLLKVLMSPITWQLSALMSCFCRRVCILNVLIALYNEVEHQCSRVYYNFSDTILCVTFFCKLKCASAKYLKLSHAFGCLTSVTW
jgi:hypothetical protein